MQRTIRWAEYGLWLIGLLALGYCGLTLLRARIAQVRLNRQLEQTRTPTPASAPPVRVPLVARLEIPRLKLAAMVLEGSDSQTLELGVGHLPGTAWPGDPGNVVLTGHRDTFFRPLRNIRAQDLIHITTPQGARRYQVRSIAVVDPHDIQVLQATAQPTLTLVTCYPFDYLGAAPQRFVVQAQEAPAGQVPPGRPPVTRVAAAARPKPPAPPDLEARSTPSLTASDDQLAAVSTPGPAPGKGGLRRLHPGRLFGKLGRAIHLRKDGPQDRVSAELGVPPHPAASN